MEEKIIIDGIDYLVGHTKEYLKAAIPYDETRKGIMVTGVMGEFLNPEVVALLQKR